MRKKRIFPLLTVLLGVVVLFPGINSLAAELVALDTLRQEFIVQKKLVVLEKTRREVFNSYIEKLIALENDLRIKNRGIKKVETVRQEIRAVRKELGSSPQVESEVPPQASLFVVEPKSKPAPTRASAPAPMVVSDLAIPPLYDPVAEEAAAKKAAKEAAEEASRKAAEAVAAQKAAEEAARKAAQATAAKEAAEEAAAEAAAKKAAEEVARKAAAEVAAKKAAEEVARKAAAEAAAKKAAEEAVRKTAAEAAAKKAAEEVARKVAAKTAAKKAAEEAVKKAARKATAAKPVAKTAASNRPGRSHVSNVQGQAAAADFSKHNVYAFDLPKVGKVSTLTFWATGRRNIDSYGKIWLITPDGRREKIGIWEVSNVSTAGASSYKEMPAIEHDISKLVIGPGTYKVEFEWTDGDGPLYIYRVELAS